MINNYVAGSGPVVVHMNQAIPGEVERAWGNYCRQGFERSILATPAGRISYHAAGRGQPVVFLHGLGGGASSWSWAYVAPAFRMTHRVVSADLIGWGLSEHPARLIGFADYVTAIATLLEELGGNAVVVAQSLSAGFAMAVAAQRPDLVARLVMTNPTGLKDFGGSGFPLIARLILSTLARTPGVRMAFYRSLFHRRSFIANWYEQQGFADETSVPAEIVDGALYSATRPNAAFSALPFLTGDIHYDIVPYLQEVKVPASIIIGGDPGFVGVRNATRLVSLRPDIPITIIEQTKGCPELERPNAVIDAIRASLQQP
jgi:haloalkane dehalogenase